MRPDKFLTLIFIISATMVFTGINQSSARKTSKHSKKKIYDKRYGKNDPYKRIKELPFNVSRKGVEKYRITFKFTLVNRGVNLTKLHVALPYPDTTLSRYQKVSNINMPAGWQKKRSSNGEYHAKLIVDGRNLPAVGQTKSYSYTFDVELYGMKASGSMNKKYTATLNSGNRQYLGNDHPYIDKNNATIRSISNTLWSQSKNNPLIYAKKAYEYVGSNYRYLNAYTGLHPVSTILRNNGGDCGNLSSLFISLMQARNIPARHLVAVSPRQNYHAWAEFYLDKVGWVPVDVTYKNKNRNGDYFGNYNISTAHIVLHKRLNMSVIDINGRNFISPILQSYLWWVHGSGGTTSLLTPTFKVTSQRL